MIKTSINLLIALLYYSVSIISFNPLFAQTTSIKDQKDQWRVDYEQVEQSIMVNGSGQSDDAVKIKLGMGQAFALFGAFSFVICGNLSAFDVDLWAAGSVYYTASHIIINRDEKKMAQNVIDHHQAEQSILATLSPDKKLERNEQIRSLEEVLKVQRETIKLIKRQNQLLKHMRVIYYSALVGLAGLLFIPGIGVNLNCIQNNEAAIKKLVAKIKKTIGDIFGTLSKIQTGFSLIKSFSYFKHLPEDSLIRTTYNELLREEQKMQKERFELQKILSAILNQFIPSVYAGNGNPKIIVNTRVGTGTGTGAGAGAGATDDFGKFAVKKGGVVAGEAASVAKIDDIPLKLNFVEKAMETINKTILNPYVRLGLYGTMGTITHFGVQRNNKDITTYESKIDNFDKKVQELKANISQGLVASGTVDGSKLDKDKNKNSSGESNLDSCVSVAGNNSFVFDETCGCKKTNTCFNLKKYVPPNADKQTKKLFDDLNKVFNGDSSYVYDDKKADALHQNAASAAETSIAELNKSLISKGEKPIDMKGNINKILKLSSAPTKQKLAVNSTGNKSTGLTRDDLSDLGLEAPDSNNGRSGIHLQDSDVEDVTLQDVHSEPEDSLFDVISLRYIKSALPLLKNESASSK